MIKIGKHEVPNDIGTHKIPGGKVGIGAYGVTVSTGDRGCYRAASSSDRTTQQAADLATVTLRNDLARDVRYWRTKVSADKRIAEIRKDEAREVERLRKKIAVVRKRAKAARSRVPKIVAQCARDLAKAEKELAIVKGWSK